MIYLDAFQKLDLIFTIVFILLFNIGLISEDLLTITKAKITGKKVALIVGISSAIEGDSWYSLVEDSDGILSAWRYPSSKIGKVDLDQDGTGEYCGDVLWVYV